MMSDLFADYDEETRASLRAHLLFLYGRMAELDSIGMNLFGVSGISAKGKQEYQQLLASGFTPNRDRLIHCLLIEGSVQPNYVEYAVSMLMDFDEMLNEISNDLREGAL